MKTLLCVILDRSGSMSGREADVVGGVNTFLEGQRAVPGEALVSLVRFDTEIETFVATKPLALVEPLKPSDFVPRGQTALLDAIGRTLARLDQEWWEHRPDKAIVVIVTDGAENASREFKRERIKEMIQARERSERWSFIYLGANVDAFAEAAAMGFTVQNTAGYANTEKGVRATYGVVSQSVMNMRTGVADDAMLGGNIAEDGTIDRSTTPANLGRTSTTKPDAVDTWSPPA